MFDEEDVKFWSEVLKEKGSCEKCGYRHNQLWWSDHPEGFNDHPRCKKCLSNKDFITECLDWKTNEWLVECFCCSKKSIRKHVMVIYENRDGVLFIDGKIAIMPSFMKKN